VIPILLDILQQEHQELRPRALLPECRIEFYRFANVNNTIRLRQGRVLVRISDLLETAPESVLRAILHILLAKLYRKPIAPGHLARYRQYVSSQRLSAKVHLIRQMRGRKRILSAQGKVYNLDQIFDDLNQRFFHGLLGRPQMTWSQDPARNHLGHFDPAHNTIVISRVFDHKKLPRFVLEYLVYHEMLHLKYPVKLKGTRRCVHSGEFRAEEKLFPRVEEAKRILKLL
jgi:hypothetical protein